MKTKKQFCLNLSITNSYTGNLRDTSNTKMESADLILVSFLQKEL